MTGLFYRRENRRVNVFPTEQVGKSWQPDALSAPEPVRPGAGGAGFGYFIPWRGRFFGPDRRGERGRKRRRFVCAMETPGGLEGTGYGKSSAGEEWPGSLKMAKRKRGNWISRGISPNLPTGCQGSFFVADGGCAEAARQSGIVSFVVWIQTVRILCSGGMCLKTAAR